MPATDGFVPIDSSKTCLHRKSGKRSRWSCAAAVQRHDRKIVTGSTPSQPRREGPRQSVRHALSCKPCRPTKLPRATSSIATILNMPSAFVTVIVAPVASGGAKPRAVAYAKPKGALNHEWLPLASRQRMRRMDVGVLKTHEAISGLQHRRRRSLASGLPLGKDPVGTREVTGVTPRSLLEIILMLRLCFPEIPDRLDLCHNLALPKT